MKPGQIFLVGNTLIMTPWNDVIAEHQMKKFVDKQRAIGKRYVNWIVIDLEIKLGLK